MDVIKRSWDIIKLSDIKFGSVTINSVYEKKGCRYYETNQFK